MRSQWQFGIQRGGTSIRNVQRYLRASGLDDPRFVTDAMRQRHIHPRLLRSQHAPGHTDLMVLPESIDAYLEKNPLPEPINPFAALGKKPDAPDNR